MVQIAIMAVLKAKCHDCHPSQFKLPIYCRLLVITDYWYRRWLSRSLWVTEICFQTHCLNQRSSIQSKQGRNRFCRLLSVYKLAKFHDRKKNRATSWTPLRIAIQPPKSPSGFDAGNVQAVGIYLGTFRLGYAINLNILNKIYQLSFKTWRRRHE